MTTYRRTHSRRRSVKPSRRDNRTRRDLRKIGRLAWNAFGWIGLVTTIMTVARWFAGGG